MKNPTLTILIPAAGASSRMRGQDKLLLEIEGQPLLRRTARIALAAHPNVLITLRPDDDARRHALQTLPLHILSVSDAPEGLSASLRAAAAFLTSGTTTGALMILPADMPDLTAQDLRQMTLAAHQWPTSIHRATAADGTPGHPVIFPPDLLPAFAHLTGDEGARSLLQTHPHRLRLIPLPGTHALTDLDTPEAWAAWRETARRP